MVRNIVILGATGSIGTSALGVIRGCGERFNVVGIAANTGVEKLARIAHEFGVKNVGIFDGEALRGKQQLFPRGTEFFLGENGINDLAGLRESDSVLVAIVGSASVKPTVSAVEHGKTVLLASKEALVIAGRFIVDLAKQRGVRLLPVDSEHNAIFQCLQGANGKFVEKLIITASGGPFRNFSRVELENVTAEMALSHPVWKMGPKITIDSATMANKGFEIIEARWLFHVPEANIDVVVHPEGLVHSMVKFCDGSIMAQMSPPNMEFPIAHCLFFPARRPKSSSTIDFWQTQRLNFFKPDTENFSNLTIARQCLLGDGNACAVFHGANEIAVEEFLRGRIKFLQMNELVIGTLDAYAGERSTSLESAMVSVEKARAIAGSIAHKISRFGG
jgi:1-deoxy-D-xylulose-5-phosphate reductoisomerase